MSSCGVAASADGVGHSGLVLYVNGEYRDDSDIGKLMHDFNCTSADDMNFEILAEKTRYLKENPKGVSEMCKVTEDLRDEAMQKVMQRGGKNRRQMTAKNSRAGSDDRADCKSDWLQHGDSGKVAHAESRIRRITGMASVLYDLRMIRLAFLFGGSQRQSRKWGGGG